MLRTACACALLLLAARDSWGLPQITVRKTYGRELITSADKNADMQHFVDAINDIRDYLPGTDSLAITYLRGDTLRVKGIRQLGDLVFVDTSGAAMATWTDGGSWAFNTTSWRKGANFTIVGDSSSERTDGGNPGAVLRLASNGAGVADQPRFLDFWHTLNGWNIASVDSSASPLDTCLSSNELRLQGNGGYLLIGSSDAYYDAIEATPNVIMWTYGQQVIESGHKQTNETDIGSGYGLWVRSKYPGYANVLRLDMSASSETDTSNYFIRCMDSTATRFGVYGNGAVRADGGVTAAVVSVADTIGHTGDSNTYQLFTPDAWKLVAGGQTMLSVVKASMDTIGINKGNDAVATTIGSYYGSSGLMTVFSQAGSVVIGNPSAMKSALVTIQSDSMVATTNRANPSRARAALRLTGNSNSAIPRRSQFLDFYRGSGQWCIASYDTSGSKMDTTTSVLVLQPSGGQMIIGYNSVGSGDVDLTVYGAQTNEYGGVGPVAHYINFHETAPLGVGLEYTCAVPNDSLHPYLYCIDASLTSYTNPRFAVWSNGGVHSKGRSRFQAGVDIGTLTGDHDLEINDGATFSEIDAGEAQFTVSSSRELKDVGPELDADLAERVADVLTDSMQVRRWRWKREAVRDAARADKQHVGLVAEEAYRLARLVAPEDCRPDQINYNHVTTGLILTVQHQQRELRILRAEVDSLKRQAGPEGLGALQDQIDDLQGWVIFLGLATGVAALVRRKGKLVRDESTPAGGEPDHPM